MTEKESRARGVCVRCGGPPTLVKREDGGGWRALFWCMKCAKPAHSGASFVRVEPDVLATLPIVAYRTAA